MSSSSQRPKQITLQRAESTWYGCQIAPGAISGAIGLKSTRRQMSIPVPTFRHTAFVGDNFENDYDQATTKHQLSYFGRRVEKTLLICSHGRVGCVPAPHGGAG